MRTCVEQERCTPGQAPHDLSPSLPVHVPSAPTASGIIVPFCRVRPCGCTQPAPSLGQKGWRRTACKQMQ